jgi:two-component system response regulator FixJ
MANSPVVHVIDDDDAIRDSLAFLLESAGIAVRTYSSATAFLDELRGTEVSCVVTDVRMPDIDGIALLQRLRDLGRNLPVIVMTGHAEVPLAVQAMKMGAVDFLEKPFNDEALLASIHAALDSQNANSRREVELGEYRTRLATLSPREQQVLAGLVSGQPNKVIAFDLKISPRTVEIYRANVMTKMNAASLSDLVRMALLVGLFEDAPARAPRKL